MARPGHCCYLGTKFVFLEAVRSPESRRVARVRKRKFWWHAKGCMHTFVLLLKNKPSGGCLHLVFDAGIAGLCFLERNGAPGQIRTGDPLLRRQTLYPTELRAHPCGFNDFRSCCSHFTPFQHPFRLHKTPARAAFTHAAATFHGQSRKGGAIFMGPCEAPTLNPRESQKARAEDWSDLERESVLHNGHRADGNSAARGLPFR